MPSGLPLCQDPDQPTLHEVPEADLDSLHVIQWERDIIWDDPDDSHTAAELRSDAQNGAAAQPDDWDDLDRALEMDLEPPRSLSKPWQRPTPVLEPLPCRPPLGGLPHDLAGQCYTILRSVHMRHFVSAGTAPPVYMRLLLLSNKQR